MPEVLSASLRPSALARMAERNTVIEDAPQVSIRRATSLKPLNKPNVLSPLSDDFPTPKGNTFYTPALDISPSSSATPSDGSDSIWSKRSSRSQYDEMYDITESESEGEVPIKLSSSVKRRMGASAKISKYPSLVIPSPSQWPTIEKMKGATPLSPPTQVILSPSILKRMMDRSLRVPSTSSTPSLDGGSTSGEDAASLSSCPSTPDLAHADDNEEVWEAPIQLDPSSISLLHHLSAESREIPQEAVIEVPTRVVEEMKQIVESPPITAPMKLETQGLAPPNAEDELSALSVPSPGGFFSSLDTSIARHAWSGQESAPSTSVATEFYSIPFQNRRSSTMPTSTVESFYNVPWTSRPDNPIEHSISVDLRESQQGPLTAIKTNVLSPSEVIAEVAEIDETYDTALKQSAAANIDRTQLWLSAQDAYMEAICDDAVLTESFKDIPDATPKTPEQTSPFTSDDSPSKKSVRFADNVIDEAGENTAVEKKRISPIHDGTFWEAWRHTKRSARARDVFQHRQARAEAEHVKRISCQKQHLEQLQGKYEIATASRPNPTRPISTLVPTAAEDQRSAVIQQAEREREALEQISMSSWQLSAQKELQGGSLLTSPVVQTFKSRRGVKILDLQGQVHCGWAWSVAMEHPKALVYTTVSSDAEAHVAESTLEGPENHVVVAAPKPWELPFGDKYFDVISARNLYAYLKTTWPKGAAADEWDLTLRECSRILKPGGYMEFNLLDAEFAHPDSNGHSLGVEFAVNLKSRGYDPYSGKNFLPRLKRAGFQEIKRAWMILPVADVVPRWVDSGKTPGSTGSTDTIRPSTDSDGYFGSPASIERSIGPNGEVEHYNPPVTGSSQNVRAITGLVGARMWEQWMLKLNCEMGRNEARCLEGVAKALEEGGKGNAGWKCLVGWARKAS